MTARGSGSGKARVRKSALVMPRAMTQQNDAKLRRLLQRLLRDRPGAVDESDPTAVLHELQVHQIELEMQNRELRGAQAVLEQSRERYADLYDNAPVGYVTLDANGVIRDANLVAAAMLGTERGELLGKPFSASLERGQSTAFFNYLKQVLAQEVTQKLEVRMRGAGDARRDVRLIGVARQDPESGERVGRIALSDVTEEKQQHETLRLHSLIMDHMIEGVVLVRAADSVIIETNPAFDRMFGYDAGELIGRHISVVNTANSETPQQIVARIATELRRLGRWEGEVHNVRKDGGKFWTQAAVTSFVHATHGPVWVCVQRDLTERKRAEQQARERQDELAHVARLNTVGELAATLAHELTQPVMAIEHFNHAAIGLAESGNGTREELLQLLRSADQQVKRAGDVIRQLRKFVRRGVVEKQPVSVPRAIDEALVLLRPLLDDHEIEVRTCCDAALAPVNADVVQIEQVLVNLLRNCVEALAAAKNAKRCIDVSCAQHADRVEVIVHDNGPGLDPAREKTLFDLFESQKIDGMGMGLAISRSIIEAHGGQLWAEPATTGGATFHFTLPICQQRGACGA